MKFKKLLIALITFAINQICICQTTNCLTDFNYLVKKIQADYPGYNDKVTDANRSLLSHLESTIRQNIVVHPDSCSYYMNEYTDFFKDRHLYVSRIRKDNKQVSEIMDTSTYGKNLYFNIDSLKQATKNAKGIEGVWQGFGQKFVIVKDGGKYVGVVINNQGWKTGQVLYEFERRINDTVFNVINHSLVKGKKTYTATASLHLNGKIIEIHDETRFVRETNSDVLDKAILSSYEPIFPNGQNTYPVATYLDDSTYYLRIPEFYSNTGNELVIKNWNEIMARPNLIIDIRNNRGGQDDYFQQLLKLVYTKPYESKGVEWYASNGNIRFFEDAIKKGEIRNGEEGMKWTQTLVDAMKKNVGGFVTHPYNISEAIIKMDTIYSMPRKIGIIINEGNASSAEQFLLAAKQSDKVILFGNCNTAGVIDYSNVTSIPLPSGEYQIKNPMTRSKRLPKNPIDNIGIAPDIIIPFPSTEQLYDKLDSWVYFVRNYLEFLNQPNR